MMPLIQPKQIDLEIPDGGLKTFTISKFDSVSGREIVAKYPIAAMPPKFGGDYSVSEDTMLKLMAFVEIDNNGTPLRLTTINLVRNHVPDWETLAKLEWSMMEYNCSFFQQGRLSGTLEKYAQKVLQLISQTLTASSVPLSPTTKQP